MKRTLKFSYYLLAVTVVGILFFGNCGNKKDENEVSDKDLPVISTIEVTEITQTTAVSGGIITGDGGTPVLARGVCWSPGSLPTIKDPKTEDGKGEGSFTSSITGLLPNTTYHVRAYATNSAGTSYGDDLSFTTPKQVEEFIFRDDFDGSSVNEEVWRIGGWTEHGGQLGRERVYVKDGLLHMELINDNGNILSSAIQTRAENKFLYGKWEARLKPTSVRGVLNSFYTIDWRDGAGTRQEVDIEFLTVSFGENKGEVHFAVHAAGFQSFNTHPDIKLDFNPSDDFHVWGLEITPEQIEWSVDGKSLLVYKYKPNGVKITHPYMLKLNTRSEPGWIQGPSAPGVLSTYLIDWIQFTEYKEE